VKAWALLIGLLVLCIAPLHAAHDDGIRLADGPDAGGVTVIWTYTPPPEADALQVFAAGGLVYASAVTTPTTIHQFVVPGDIHQPLRVDVLSGDATILRLVLPMDQQVADIGATAETDRVSVAVRWNPPAAQHTVCVRGGNWPISADDTIACRIEPSGAMWELPADPRIIPRHGVSIVIYDESGQIVGFARPVVGARITTLYFPLQGARP
jgi:hypothetical protein